MSREKDGVRVASSEKGIGLNLSLVLNCRSVRNNATSIRKGKNHVTIIKDSETAASDP